MEIHLKNYRTKTAIDLTNYFMGEKYLVSRTACQKSIRPILEDIERRRANDEKVGWYLHDDRDDDGVTAYPVVTFEDEVEGIFFKLLWS